MSRLIAWVGTIFDLVRSGFRILGQAWVAIGAALVAVIAFTVDSVQWFLEKIPEFLGMIGSLITAGQNSSMFSQGSAELDILNMANTFFPLNELISSVTFLSATWLIATGIRTVKAWIPTLG